MIKRYTQKEINIRKFIYTQRRFHFENEHFYVSVSKPLIYSRNFINNTFEHIRETCFISVLLVLYIIALPIVVIRNLIGIDEIVFMLKEKTEGKPAQTSDEGCPRGKKGEKDNEEEK